MRPPEVEAWADDGEGWITIQESTLRHWIETLARIDFDLCAAKVLAILDGEPLVGEDEYLRRLGSGPS